MKKLIVTTMSVVALIAATASSYGQGQIQFQNNTAVSPLTYGSNDALAGQRTFGPSGTYEYGLYIGAAGATSISQMILIDTAQNIASTSGSATAGLISGGTVSGFGNVGVANGFANGLVAGNTYSYMVAVWTKSSGADYTTAFATGVGYFGLSGVGSIVPSASPSPVTQMFGVGAGQLGGFTIQTAPEPGTLVLGGLGAASLLLFRRRKN